MSSDVEKDDTISVTENGESLRMANPAQPATNTSIKRMSAGETTYP